MHFRTNKLCWLCLFILLGGGCCEIDTTQPAVQVDLAVNHNRTAEQLLQLTDAVGADFHRRSEYVSLLRDDLRIKRIRLINVDNGENELINGQLIARKLALGLRWCREVGAAPHIVIGQGIPRWLSTYQNDPLYGPSDFEQYRAYIQKIFRYVIITNGFKDATWEVANEPDIDAAPHVVYPQSVAFGRDDDYRSYLSLYRTIAEQAVKFELDNPGLKVPLGGPVTTIFSFGDTHWVPFNWHERFLADIARRGIKLDFFVFHFYGNGSAIANRPVLPSAYPSFEEIMAKTQGWIDQYKPGLPIWLSEWGPSYHTNMSPAGIFNGNYVGGAWSAAFINSMLQSGVSKAFLLNTNDMSPQNWGWPALLHEQTRKPIYHVLRMFRSLTGQLLQTQDDIETVDAIAEKNGETFRVVVWNFNWLRGEFDAGFEGAERADFNVNIKGMPEGMLYTVKRTLISQAHGNPIAGPLVAEPQTEYTSAQSCVEGVSVPVSLPPSSVMLLEFTPEGLGS